MTWKNIEKILAETDLLQEVSRGHHVDEELSPGVNKVLSLILKAKDSRLTHSSVFVLGAPGTCLRFTSPSPAPPANRENPLTGSLSHPEVFFCCLVEQNKAKIRAQH